MKFECAIAMRVEIGSRTVGYLPREFADQYQTALGNNTGKCSAKMARGFKLEDGSLAQLWREAESCLAATCEVGRAQGASVAAGGGSSPFSETCHDSGAAFACAILRVVEGAVSCSISGYLSKLHSPSTRVAASAVAFSHLFTATACARIIGVTWRYEQLVRVNNLDVKK